MVTTKFAPLFERNTLNREVFAVIIFFFSKNLNGFIIFPFHVFVTTSAPTQVAKDCTLIIHAVFTW